MVRWLVPVVAIACNTGSAPEPAPATPPPPKPDTAAPVDAATIDVDSAAIRVFELWKDGKLAQIRDEGHPEFKTTVLVATLERIRGLMADAAGDFIRVDRPFAHATDPNGDLVVTGPAVYAKGTLAFKLAFRVVDGRPLLVDLNLALPKELQVTPDPKDADTLARQMLDGLLHKMVRTELVDPGVLVNMAPPAEIAAKLGNVLDQLGPIRSTKLLDQQPCGGGSCIVYEVKGAKGTGTAGFEVAFKVRKWTIRSFALNPPAKPK
jgi:hypothetical protein